MEKRINDLSKQYVAKFKDDVRKKIMELGLGETEGMNELIEYIIEYDRLCFEKDDFLKRKRIKNAVPQINRCNAKRANGEQCTRKRRDGCEFCGTHYKGTPHGLITGEESDEPTQETVKIEVFAEDISGIVYYIDKYGNVYKTDDILNNLPNPNVIAKWVKNNGKYTIPEFGLM